MANLNLIEIQITTVSGVTREGKLDEVVEEVEKEEEEEEHGDSGSKIGHHDLLDEDDEEESDMNELGDDFDEELYMVPSSFDH